jgi:polyphosphate kinase 2 (PPK2 family)
MADDMTKRIARFIEPFRVTPGSSVTLATDFDPAFKAGIEKKKDGASLLNDGIALLSDVQQRLAAQATHGVVVVLQALDAAGKDGTIRHVMSGVNPQGVRVESFKVPSARELDQDYLRRYQERLPARGEIGISTVPTTRRCSSPGCIRSTSSTRSCRPSRADIMAGSAATRPSTSGSAT